METVFAILVCLVLLGLIVIGEIYLAMDKQKARAIVYIKKMSVYMDEWVRRTAEMAESPIYDRKSADAFRALSHEYFGYRKYKDTLKKITLVNSMAELSEPLEFSAGNAGAEGLLSARLDAAANIGLLRTEYNECARKLNDRLKKRIPAVIGKLFRMSALEELRDLAHAERDS